MSYESKQPQWLQDHPKDLIYKIYLPSELRSSDIDDPTHDNENLMGAVWYRPIDAGFEIDHIEVPKTLRGQGWGQKLLEGFIEFCREQKNSHSFEIWLEVSSKNIVAQKLYLKLGFKQVHLRPKYYEDLSDALVMTLEA